MTQVRQNKMSRLMTKPTKWPLRKAKISLGICPVWSEASLCALMIAKDLSFPHVGSKDSDQTGRMSRLIWVFALRTCHFVGLVARRLKYNKMNVISMLNTGSFQYRRVRLTFRVSLSTYSVSSKDSQSRLTRLCEYAVWSESSLCVHGKHICNSNKKHNLCRG